MYPIVTGIPKWTTEDTFVDSGRICVPKHSFITLHVTGIHYNPKYWENPTEFQPERFLKEYNKDAFIPFSDGQRACIGKRFSIIESQTILFMIVKAFKLEVPEGVDKRTYIEAKIELTLLPNEREIKITKR